MVVVAARTGRAASVQQLIDVAVPVLLAVLSVTQLVADPPPGNPALLDRVRAGRRLAAGRPSPGAARR